MKKNLIYIAAALVLAGCTKEAVNEVSQPVGEPIRFEAAAPTGRTVVETTDAGTLSIEWADADQIGIYSALDDQPAALNVPYTAIPSDANPAYCTFTPTELSQAIYWQAASKQSFYAYYPWNEVLENEDATAHLMTLESSQIQAEANSPAHLAEYGLMTAAPFEVEANMQRGNVSFAFKSAFSIVEFRLKATDDCPIAELPVKAMTLTTTGAPLTGAVAVNLTQSPATFTVKEASQSLTLELGETVGLKKDGYTSFYMMVLPGTHAADALALELTAIDNSKQTITIAEGVTFEPNKHYVREGVLTLEGFKLEQPFEIELPAIEAKVGEPFTVAFKGVAEQIEFWSGEKGHDYAYANQDRLDEALIKMNMQVVYGAGNQMHPVKVKCSTDFDGTMTEEAILAATWTDVSDQFIWPDHIHGTAATPQPDGSNYPDVGKNTVPTDSGIVDCTEWVGDDRSVWIALFYHINAPGNRTFFYLFDSWVKAIYVNGEEHELYVQRFATENNNKMNVKIVNEEGATNPLPTFVLGSNYASNDNYTFQLSPFTNDPVAYPYYFRIGAKYNGLTSNKDAYYVLPKITRPAPHNLGKDKPFEIQAADAETPASWSYTFTEPGTYKVYVIGTIMTLAGEQEVIKEVTVTVTA